MMQEFLKQNQEILQAAQKRAGIDSAKVQKTAVDYIQIAKDNQLNYNELLQVFSLVKESVLQSLNKLAISDLPNIISEAAKEAVDNLGYKPLKSDNIELGCAIPLPDGSKGIVARQVESVDRKKIN